MTHDARTLSDSIDLCRVPWRVGGSVGRTVYAVLSDTRPDPDPALPEGRDDDSVLIGMFDSSALAASAVATHNRYLAEVIAALGD